MKKTREDIAIDLVEGDRILDVGCWRGYTSETLAKRYKEVIGIDLLPKEIEKAKKRVKAKNVRFEVLCRAVELFGFRFRGGKGSHKIYVKEGVREMLNFQNVKGRAKPYQVKQFLKVIERYKLLEEEDV